MQLKQRNPYWDICKGISILAVILIHATNSTAEFPPYSFNWQFGIFFRQLINFAVPIFLGLAGFFSYKDKSSSSSEYLLKRVSRILFPYLSWSFIYVFLRSGSAIINLPFMARGLLTGTTINVGYFVIILIQFTLITLLLRRIKHLWIDILVIVLLTLFGIAFSYYFRVYYTDSFFSSFPGTGLLFYVWYPFYHVGFIFSKYNLGQYLTPKHIPRLGWLLLLFFVASCFEGYYWATRGMYSLGISQIQITSFSMSIVLLVIMLSGICKFQLLPGGKFISLIGARSYSLYLTHMLFMGITAKFLSRLHFLYGLQPLFVFLLALITLFSCVLLDRIFQRVLPPKFFSIIFG